MLIRAIMQKEQFVESLAAMSATMLGAAETATNILKWAYRQGLLLNGSWKLIVIGAGPKAY